MKSMGQPGLPATRKIWVDDATVTERLTAGELLTISEVEYEGKQCEWVRCSLDQVGGHDHVAPLDQVGGRSFIHRLVGPPLNKTGALEGALL